jgi:hypothetical protein
VAVCGREWGGKTKRSVGCGNARFKGGPTVGRERKGGSDWGAMWRATEGGGPGPTSAARGRHRPWNGGCGRRAARGAPMPLDRRETRDPSEAHAWVPVTVPCGLAIRSVQTKFNEFK